MRGWRHVWALGFFQEKLYHSCAILKLLLPEHFWLYLLFKFMLLPAALTADFLLKQSFKASKQSFFFWCQFVFMPVSSSHFISQMTATCWKENSNWGENPTTNSANIVFSFSRSTESCRQRSVVSLMLVFHTSVILLFLFLFPPCCRHHSRHHLQCACQCL